MEKENDYGNIEYKLKLINDSEQKIEELTSQMLYRITEGSGECVYFLGVNDYGELIGLDSKESEISISILKTIAKKNECVIMEISSKNVEDTNRKIYEILIRQNIESKYIDIKIAVAGNVDSGKSSLIGVLINGQNDNGRGSARLSVFNFEHEVKSGRTSSIAHHILGFDALGKIVNYESKKDWTEIVKASTKIISFYDLAGHEKYLKTTILGLSSAFPDLCIITVGANMGITRMTKEHIFLCVILNIPFCIVVTKIDICKDRQNIMKETVDNIKKVLKMPGIRRITYRVNNKEDSMLCSKNLATYSVVPLFFVSNVTGHGLDNLKSFLNFTNKHKSNINNEKENVEYHIDTIFYVTGVGTVTGGHLKYGTIKTGDKLMLGPNTNNYEVYQVKSIHCKKTLVDSVSASCYVCLSLRKANKKNIRRGNVLLSINSKKVYVTEFLADVTILKTHSTTIKVGYEPVIHVSAIRQSAKIIEIINKISNKKNNVNENDDILRTGDKALVKFRFRYRAEFLKPGNKILLAEGKVKIIGTVKEIL